MRQSRSASWVLTGVWLALLAFATVSVAAALLFYVPRQKRIFDEFGLQLPWLTKSIINLSSFVSQYWWLLLPPILGAVCGPVLLLRHALRWRILGTVFAAVALTLLIAGGLLILFAIAQPVGGLMRGLSK